MRFGKKLNRNTKQAVFALEVDFKYEMKERYGLLKPGRTYFFQKANSISKNESEISYSRENESTAGMTIPLPVALTSWPQSTPVQFYSCAEAYIAELAGILPRWVT